MSHLSSRAIHTDFTTFRPTPVNPFPSSGHDAQIGDLRRKNLSSVKRPCIQGSVKKDEKQRKTANQFKPENLLWECDPISNDQRQLNRLWCGGDALNKWFVHFNLSVDMFDPCPSARFSHHHPFYFHQYRYLVFDSAAIIYSFFFLSNFDSFII